MKNLALKNLARLAALAFGAASLAGCAELQQAESFITSPQTQSTIAVLKSGARALICAVANASALASVIETQYAGQSIIGTDQKVYVTSATVCASLGGTLAGTGTIP
jgi:ABC-type uncharacterized transport system auxiliary subunit